jgi:hypothetical protein
LEPRWHDIFTSLLGGDDPNLLGQYVSSVHPPISAAFFWPLAFFPEDDETVTTYCGLFDVQDHTDAPVGDGPPSVFVPNSVNIYGTPSERASDLAHEGMHAHYRDSRELDHLRCPGDTLDGGCDHFFSHLKSDFAGNDLNKANTTREKIPAYELQLEYLCDLVDEAEDHSRSLKRPPRRDSVRYVVVNGTV